MANLPARIKCDQCGTVIDRKDATAWLNIRNRKDMVSFYAADRGVDLCSAACLLDYATDQAGQ